MPRLPDWLGMGELCSNKALGRKRGERRGGEGRGGGEGKEAIP